MSDDLIEHIKGCSHCQDFIKSYYQVDWKEYIKDLKELEGLE